MSEKELILREVEKLTGSAVLHGSESLCKLLRYLAAHAIDQPGVPVKEYQIATEVFGRPADFDPQSDSAIRVQAGRLRTKLSEYYGSEGAEDPILLELPKGSYALAIHHRVVEEAKRNSNGSHRFEGEVVVKDASSRRRMAVGIVLTVLVTAILVTVAQSVMLRRAADAGSRSEALVPPALQTFWKPFTTGTGDPWVVFSNAAFVGRPETGIRYYDSKKDSGERVWDHYTGVGEVLAVHSLDQVFSQLHRQIRVKRGSLMSLDDASNNDLIFLGSPSENLTLMDIPNTKEFVFQRIVSGPRKGDLAIVNVHPLAGETKDFLASPSDGPLTEDYAVIGFMPGVNRARSVMILAGTTTFGTQAAVEYLARPDSLKDLISRLDIPGGQDLPPFEALLHVKITRGVPLEAELVMVRKR